MDSSNVILQISDLSAGYGARVVLDHVNFSVAPSEIRMVLGKSGCGKSTLLNHVLGLERAITGTASYFGTQVQLGVDEIATDIRIRCGVLFQDGGLLTCLTLFENVALPLRIHRPELSKTMINDIVQEKLGCVSMQEASAKMPTELSGGMRKRGALARALVLDPKLLFCDEPTSGLDPVNAREMDDLLLKLRNDFGMAMIIVSHDLESIKLIADNILYISSGHLLLNCPLSEALKSPEPEINQFFTRSASTSKEILHGSN